MAVPMPMNRNLFVTLDMLRAEGLNASLRLFPGCIHIRLDDYAAVFQSPAELCTAANWLAECTLKNYPESQFAKLWLLLAKVAAGQVPSNDQA